MEISNIFENEYYAATESFTHRSNLVEWNGRKIQPLTSEEINGKPNIYLAMSRPTNIEGELSGGYNEKQGGYIQGKISGSWGESKTPPPPPPSDSKTKKNSNESDT